MENKNILTDNELESIVNTAAESREDSEAVDMRKIKEEVEVDLNAKLEQAEIVSDGDPADLAATTIDTMPTTNASLFDLEGDQVVEEETAPDLPPNSIAAMAKDTYDLTDDEVINMLDIITNMKKDPKYPVYKNMPEKLKAVIREIAAKNAVPANQFNALARMVMLEFVSDSEIQNVFIDLEKSLNEALKLPSVMDLYTEHTRTVMEENIPKMVEEIKDTEPEKADLLLKVKDAFTKSYTYSFAKEEYEKNSRVRKAVRKHDKSLKRALDEFNFRNEKSNFKMNDVRELPEVLSLILIGEASSIFDACSNDGSEVPVHVQKAVNLKVTEDDIDKFCILICKSCDNHDPKDIVDAAYMYYMMKNIIVLKHSNEAKTDFAAELISNICDTITFIRDKEAEFNAANMDKSKSRA